MVILVYFLYAFPIFLKIFEMGKFSLFFHLELFVFPPL